MFWKTFTAVTLGLGVSSAASAQQFRRLPDNPIRQLPSTGIKLRSGNLPYQQQFPYQQQYVPYQQYAPNQFYPQAAQPQYQFAQPFYRSMRCNIYTGDL